MPINEPITQVDVYLKGNLGLWPIALYGPHNKLPVHVISAIWSA
jgi:hypothetical protein